MITSKNQLQIHRGFLPAQTAKQLRQDFLSVFENPRFSHPKRFLWDHWFVDQQYKMHRTPAQDFFKPKLYKNLCDTLIRFGQDRLGCHTISKPWLSYYTDGDFQSLHSDSPHGPWAYVFSLTDWQDRKFGGGETQLLNPQILNYWSTYPKKTGVETNELLINIDPKFNQLLIFDPRIPHGVNRVTGAQEPSLGRLVVHGWFVQPEPYLTGALAKLDTTKQMEQINVQLAQLLSFTKASIHVEVDLRQLTGTIIFRIHILGSGKVRSSHILTNHLIDRKTGKIQNQIADTINKSLTELKFTRRRGQSELTLPLMF